MGKRFPGKSLPHVATIEASILSLATAGAAKDDAATAATPVAAAALKNLRLDVNSLRLLLRLVLLL